MLSEYQNLVPSEKEKRLQVFINQLTYDLYNNEKIEVDSKRLLELLSYLTSNENISTQMKSAIEYQNKRISDVLNKIQVEKFKDYIKYLEENSIPKQKVKDKINKYIDQKLVELTKTGSYTQNEGTPEQERLNGMQKGAKDIKTILLEDK